MLGHDYKSSVSHLRVGVADNVRNYDGASVSGRVPGTTEVYEEYSSRRRIHGDTENTTPYSGRL